MFSGKYIDQFTKFLSSRKRVPAPDVKQQIQRSTKGTAVIVGESNLDHWLEHFGVCTPDNQLQQNSSVISSENHERNDSQSPLKEIERLQLQLEAAKQALRPFAELAKALDEVRCEHYRGKWMTVDSEALIRVYSGTLDIDLSKRLPDDFDLLIVIEEFAGGNNHTIISVEDVRAARKLFDEMEHTK